MKIVNEFSNQHTYLFSFRINYKLRLHCSQMKKAYHQGDKLFYLRDPDRIRTCNLLIRSQVHYPVMLRGQLGRKYNIYLVPMLNCDSNFILLKPDLDLLTSTF